MDVMDGFLEDFGLCVGDRGGEGAFVGGADRGSDGSGGAPAFACLGAMICYVHNDVACLHAGDPDVSADVELYNLFEIILGTDVNSA
jgi:hypothetical protein